MWNIAMRKSEFFSVVTCLIKHYVNDTLYDKNHTGQLILGCQGCLLHAKAKKGKKAGASE